MATNGGIRYWIKESIKDRIFEDEYSQGKDLGQGSTASVHKCQHKGTGQFWAAKIIRKNVQKKIVLTEIGILLKIRHPNVVRLKEVFETEDRIIMILELVTGGELFDRIVTTGHYSEKDAAKAVLDILTAVDHLHDNGVVHRDLKPENILYADLKGNSPLKVADFGLSQIIEPEVKMSTICGTPGYCAPEILSGKKYEKTVDIWSVGVITYILLSGYEPFYEDNEKKMYKRIIKGEYSFPSPIWDNVSENAKDLIRKMLHMDSKKRLTAKQALKHPWVRGIAAKAEHMEGAIEQIKEFNAKRKLKQATEAVMAVSKPDSNKMQSMSIQNEQ
ncbi:hypothetical protein LOTGIDRAFT_178957 [Lottia gigantea]|uniref:Protein kinase domain-containing protein n=1 Tax=Lottia gigantea TaxID=225164 RepID=V4A020_LOTGI|nr:hypothetical protein LOTGIDRAFT_178957 [Lottia gigantea]ESO89987.1 hypothetical protein LOTGIDRAFT_178957 [Lottia gigantea]